LMDVTIVREQARTYAKQLADALELSAMDSVPELASAIREAWQHGRDVFLCGNGGSAANAMHIANDLIFGAGMKSGVGVRVEALNSNQAVLTCLGNDLGYDRIFAEQVRVKGKPGDVLVILSGSGNSPNVVKALETANAKGMKTFAILGYSGGRCKELAQHALHFPINDMQIAEDL